MDMEKIWDDTRALYFEVIETRADPRTKDWPMIRGPWAPLTVAITYAILCWNAKKITSKLPTLNLQAVILIYNFALVTISLYLVYEISLTAYLSGYNLACQPVDYSSHPLAMRMASVGWLYYMMKYVELIDTLFFTLRKKYNQISVLHVYHHSSMLILSWLVMKYAPGGQAFLVPLINSFVHAVMYTYYGLSALGKHMQKYLWWKKYLTVLQMSQFVILALYEINNLHTDCDFPEWLNKIGLAYGITLGILFLNFYVRAYAKPRGADKVNTSRKDDLSAKRKEKKS